MLGPAEILHREAGVPYLGHVNDLVTLELHDIDVVGARATARRRNRAAGARMGSMEDAVGSNVVPGGVCGERLHLVASVGQNRQNTLHPVRVLCERLYVEQRLSLGGKRGVGCAIGAASLPSLTRLAGSEEGFGYGCDRCHVDVTRLKVA